MLRLSAWRAAGAWTAYAAGLALLGAVIVLAAGRYPQRAQPCSPTRAELGAEQAWSSGPLRVVIGLCAAAFVLAVVANIAGARGRAGAAGALIAGAVLAFGGVAMLLLARDEPSLSPVLHYAGWATVWLALAAGGPFLVLGYLVSSWAVAIAAAVCVTGGWWLADSSGWQWPRPTLGWLICLESLATALVASGIGRFCGT